MTLSYLWKLSSCAADEVMRSAEWQVLGLRDGGWVSVQDVQQQIDEAKEGKQPPIRREDFTIKQSIETVVREYSREMNQRALEAKEMAAREAQFTTIPAPPKSIGTASTNHFEYNN